MKALVEIETALTGSECHLSSDKSPALGSLGRFKTCKKIEKLDVEGNVTICDNREMDSLKKRRGENGHDEKDEVEILIVCSTDIDPI